MGVRTLLQAQVYPSLRGQVPGPLLHALQGSSSFPESFLCPGRLHLCKEVCPPWLGSGPRSEC